MPVALRLHNTDACDLITQVQCLNIPLPSSTRPQVRRAISGINLRVNGVTASPARENYEIRKIYLPGSESFTVERNRMKVGY